MKEKLKQLPQSPGVYMMQDSLGNVIYVGKAKNLKNRVSQYFHDQKDRDPKVAEMIKHIYAFNYLLTDTELDAFLEECRLIKELKPRYNRQMKNTKKYIYLRIPDEPYPHVTIAKEIADHGGSYYGPYTSLQSVENVIAYLNDFYPIRKCTSSRIVKSPYGCIYGQLGSCLGVCTGRIKPDEYGIYIEKIRQLLTGNDQAAIRDLLKKTKKAAADLQFEKALKYKEYYQSLRLIIEKQRLVRISSKNKNILALEFMNDFHVKLFFIKGNHLLYGKVFSRVNLDRTEMNQSLKQMIKDIFFVTAKNESRKLTENNIDEAQIIFSYLKKNKTNINSFWFPFTRFKNEVSLNGTVQRIVDLIALDIEQQ